MANGEIKNRFIADLRSDKKKTGLMVILAVVATIVVVRAILGGSPTPARAGAKDAKPGKAQATAAKSATEAGPSKAVVDYVRKLDTTIRRDLFKPDSEFFPEAAPKVVATRPAPRKVPVGPTAQELQRQAVLEQAKSLVLHSTMVSSNSIAIINGKVLNVGQSIEGFSVVSVSSTSCTLSKNGVKVDLRIRK